MVCRAYGEPAGLSLETRPAPPLPDDGVRVAVHACGVNFPDLLVIAGRYQVRPEPPFVPGFEVAGEVLELGRAVNGLRPGEPVMAFPGLGGFADEAVAPATRVHRLPANMDFTVGAGFSAAYGTSYHALVQRARLAPGETLLVLGAAGGVGLAAVELGRALGATVVAAASTEPKRELARAHGAHHAVGAAPDTLARSVRDLVGPVHVAFDPVGGEATLGALRALDAQGRLLLVGFAAGALPALPANRVLLRELDVLGVYWGAFSEREPARDAANFEALFGLYARGELRPHVCRTWPLAQAAEALRFVAERKVTGRVALTTGRS